MSSCFVPGCNTGYRNLRSWNKKNNLKNPSIFRASTVTSETLYKWERAIRRDDKPLTPKDVVCELHFREDDIIREYVTKLRDGNEFRLKRGIPRLKSDAVPSIFPSYSERSSTGNARKRRCPDERSFVKKLASKKIRTLPPTETGETRQNTDEATPIIEFIEIHCNKQDQIEFGMEDLKEISLPSEFWTSGIVSTNLGFTCWAKDLSVISKRLVVQNDLTVKVFIGDKQVHIPGMKEVSDHLSISTLLKQLDELILCIGATEKQRSKHCSGFVCQRNSSRPKLKTCLPCKELRESILKKNTQKIVSLKKRSHQIKKNNKKNES